MQRTLGKAGDKKMLETQNLKKGQFIIIIEGTQLYDGGKYICDNILRERVVRSEEPDCVSRSSGAYYPPHHSGWNTGLYEG